MKDMKLIQQVNESKNDRALFEDMQLREFFDDRGFLIVESVNTFILGANAMLDRANINPVNSKFDDKDRKVPGDEDQSGSFDSKDIVLRFARILAGLEYFRQKNIGPSEREEINRVLDDRATTVYVKKMGAERAKEIQDEILKCFNNGRVVNKAKLEKMIADVKAFYTAKRPVSKDLKVDSFA